MESAWILYSALLPSTSLPFGSFLARLSNLKPAGQVHLGKLSGPRCYVEVFGVTAWNDDDDQSASTMNENCFKDIASIRRLTGQDKALVDLPSQAENTIRVCVEELYHRGFQNQLCHLLDPRGQKSPISGSGTGFKTLMSQWREAVPSQWFQLEGYDFFSRWPSPHPSTDPWSSDKSEMTFFRTLRELNELLQGSDDRLAKTIRRILLREGSDNRLTVFISCATFVSRGSLEKLEKSSQAFPFDISSRFVTGLRELDVTYRPIRKRNYWRQLFLLQYLHVNLNLFTQLVQQFIDNYVGSRKQDFDARSSRLRRWVLERIVVDSYHYRLLSDAGSELSETIGSLLDTVKCSLKPAPAEFSALEAELRGCCKDVQGRLSRLQADMESDIKFLDLCRNMGQASDVQLLTILGTVFLPLSLAAGILSMQSRFKDPGILLYDFFGVVVLLGAAAVLLLIAMSVAAFLGDQASRLEKYQAYTRLRPIFDGVVTRSITVYGALVLSSFVVGMFKDAGLGARILGYGTAAAVGGFYFVLAPCVAAGTLFFFLKRGDNGVNNTLTALRIYLPWRANRRLADMEGQSAQPSWSENRCATANVENEGDAGSLNTAVRGEALPAENITGNHTPHDSTVIDNA